MKKLSLIPLFILLSNSFFAQKKYSIQLIGDCDLYGTELSDFQVYSDSILLGNFEKNGLFFLEKKTKLPLLISHPKFETIIFNSDLKHQHVVVSKMKQDEVEKIIAQFENEQLETCNDSLKQIAFGIVDVQPEFPGGKTKLLSYLAANTKYPQYALEYAIQGTVYVAFIVDTEGNISCIRVRKGVDFSIDKEAFRVVKGFPTFTPATIAGKPVVSRYIIPISFRIN